LSPQEVGLPAGGRRRTPGLRREEVAALAGIGTSWYSRLEQGWDIQASTQLLRRLAQALRLDRDETVHLFELTGHPVPVELVDEEQPVGPSLQRLLDSMEFTPAYIVNKYWDRIAWNRAALALFGDFTAAPPRHRNSLWRHFALPVVRTTNHNWESVAKAMLAEFHRTTSRYKDDPQLQALIAELMEHSPEFRKWWPERDIHTLQTPSFVFKHPREGMLYLEYSSFYVSYYLGLRICILTPLPRHDTPRKLRRMVRGAPAAPEKREPRAGAKRRTSA
jgi:transcriptional regulator with XRE-family HTH domain